MAAYDIPMANMVAPQEADSNLITKNLDPVTPMLVKPMGDVNVAAKMSEGLADQTKDQKNQVALNESVIQQRDKQWLIGGGFDLTTTEGIQDAIKSGKGILDPLTLQGLKANQDAMALSHAQAVKAMAGADKDETDADIKAAEALSNAADGITSKYYDDIKNKDPNAMTNFQAGKDLFLKMHSNMPHIDQLAQATPDAFDSLARASKNYVTRQKTLLAEANKTKIYQDPRDGTIYAVNESTKTATMQNTDGTEVSIPLAQVPTTVKEIGKEPAEKTIVEKFTPVTEIEVSNPDGTTRKLEAQQSKETGQWVTADEKRTNIDVSGGFKKVKETVLGGREEVLMIRSITSALDAVSDIENMAGLPVTSTTGIFGMGHAVSSPSLWEAPKNALLNKMTPQEDQDLQVSIKGIGRALAGLATGGVYVNQSIVKQFDMLAAQPGDSQATKLRKLATMRQNADNGVDALLSNPRIGQEQRDQLIGIKERLATAVPYLPKEVTKYEKEGKDDETFTDFAARVLKKEPTEKRQSKYNSKSEIEADYNSGKLTPEQAKSALKNLGQ